MYSRFGPLQKKHKAALRSHCSRPWYKSHDLPKSSIRDLAHAKNRAQLEKATFVIITRKLITEIKILSGS